jgi:hypothetical protein
MIGIEFRRLFLTSLRALAARATDSGPLARFEAYSVTTLFHHRLPILGFAPAPADRPICRHVMSWYERTLLSSLHPAGRARLGSGARKRPVASGSPARTCWPGSGYVPESNHAISRAQ